MENKGIIKSVIILKNKFFRWFKIFFFLLCFGLTVFTAGYFYLDSQLERVYVSNKTESVPYYSAPESKGFMFDICGDKLLLHFNFAEETVSVVYPPHDLSTATDIYGYSIDYYINCDYKLVGYLTDTVGGVELENESEIYRYTGSQITEMLEYSSVKTNLKREITKKLIEGISQNGFTKENLLYITENSETDLSFSDGILFVDYIADTCSFIRFVN